MLEISAENTYLGGTTVEQGILELSGLGDLGKGADLKVEGGALFRIAPGAGLKKVANLSGGGGGVELNDNLLEIEGGIFAGSISGSQGSLKKSGASSLLLSHANTYANGTFIEGGEVRISRDHNLGDPSGMVTLSGGNLTVLEGFDSARDVTLAANGEIEVVQGTLSLSGMIDGVGALVKKGDGIVALSGTNSYSGGTDLTKGGLRIAQDVHLGSGPLTFREGKLHVTSSFASNKGISVLGSGEVEIDPNQVLRLDGTISGSGTFKKGGLGTLEVSGVNPYSGELIVDKGTLRLLDLGTLGSNAVHLSLLDGSSFVIPFGGERKRLGRLSGMGANIQLNDNHLEVESGDFSGVIEGVGATLKKVGSGTLLLAGANRYTGDTHLEGGVLSLSDDASMGDWRGDLHFNGGALRATEGHTSSRNMLLNGVATVEVTRGSLTFNGLLSGTGSLKKEGVGTLILNRMNTYAGETIFAQGSIGVIEDENLGDTSSALRFEGGALMAMRGFTSQRVLEMRASGGEVKVMRDSLSLSGVIDGVGE